MLARIFSAFAVSLILSGQVGAQGNSTLPLLPSDALSVGITEEGPDLILHFQAKKTSPVPISSPSDRVYLWDEDEHGYKYFMIGTGIGRRENLWVGVGHAANTGLDYLIISIRNLDGQFGKFYPQDLVRNFALNGRENPGKVEDGGFGVYPEREILPSDFPRPWAGIESIWVRSSMYEAGTNHFYLRFNLTPGSFQLKEWTEDRISVLGDGEIRVKAARRH